MAAGICLGVRLAGAENRISTGLIVNALLFIALCTACVYLIERPMALAVVACVTVSSIACWFGRMSKPDELRSANPYSGVQTGNDAFRVDSRDNPFGGANRREVKTAFVPRFTFGKRRLPSRTTPTGRTIKMVSSGDGNPGSKRRNASLTTVK